MPDPALVERIRDDLRAFRAATAERAATEAAETERHAAEERAATEALTFARRDAEAKRTKAIKAADATLAAEQRQADAKLAVENDSADGYQRTAQQSLSKNVGAPTSELRQVGLEELMATPVEPAPVREDADLGLQLAQHAATASAAVASTRESTVALTKWRTERNRRRAIRRKRLTFAAMLLIIGAFFGVMYLLTEQQYQAATTALAAGDWQKARDTTPIKYVWYFPYKDSADLHEQSYYLPGLAALNAGRWEEARQNFGQTNYKDAKDLYLESYYRAGVAALNAKDWPRAQAEFNALMTGAPNYKDTKDLILETYYRPGVAALDARDWPRAQTEFRTLTDRAPNYKDAKDLMLESFYRPGVVAHDAKDWPRAQTEFKALTERAPNYKDAPQRYFDALTEGKIPASFEYPRPASPPTGIRMEIGSVEMRPINADTYQLVLNLRLVAERNSGATVPAASAAVVKIAAVERRANAVAGIFADPAGAKFIAAQSSFSSWMMKSNTDTGTIIFEVPKAGGVADCFAFSYGDVFVYKQICFRDGKRTAASPDSRPVVAELDQPARVMARRPRPDDTEE